MTLQLLLLEKLCKCLQELTNNRRSKSEKKKIQICMAKLLQVCNHCRGGVDLFDPMVATYRRRIKSKHWWWPFFAWPLNAAMTDEWLLLRMLHNNSI